MKRTILALLGLGMGLANAGTTPVSRGTDTVRTQHRMAAENLGRALPLLREGDIIFISRIHPLYRRIAETSRSWESHVGILLRNSKGAWTVAQSTIPVSNVVPLDRFVGASDKGRFLVRRLRGGISADGVDRLRAATARRMGVVYDPGFKYDSQRQYCSKFVFDCFHEATGQQVGRLETFADMLAENPRAPVAFWRAWFLGRIPWERRCTRRTWSPFSTPKRRAVRKPGSTPAQRPRR